MKIINNKSIKIIIIITVILLLTWLILFIKYNSLNQEKFLNNIWWWTWAEIAPAAITSLWEE